MKPLDISALRWSCDPQQFEFQSTDEICDFSDIIGQARASESVRFAVTIRQEGFNLYVLGPPGIGKRTVVEKWLHVEAAKATVPDDWCYVNCLQDIRRPQAIRLPAGRGERFRQDVAGLVRDLETAIPAALESEEHKSRILEATRAEAERQQEAFQVLANKAQSQQIQLIRTPGGFALGPLRNGEVLSAEQFEQLPEEEKTQVEQSIAALQKELEAVIELVPRWNQETREKLQNLNRDAVRLAIAHLIPRVKELYADLPQARAYLDTIERDVLERVDEFQPLGQAPNLLINSADERPSLGDYEVNLLVDNSGTVGAPIVYEDHPSYRNLIGRMENESHMGALTTDFSLIKAGALHRANGGFLILDAARLLQQPFAWEGLKRALFARSIKIESLGELLSLISTVTLEPEPIPLDVKVVLLGDRLLFYLLCEYDQDFAELFKVAADFDEHFERTPENCQQYAQFLATLARREELRPLTRQAVARVLEHAVRDASDQDKLSLHMRRVADVLREADYWAGRDTASLIDVHHIKQAIDQQIFRSDRIRQQLQEQIFRRVILIDTDGSRVGQVNGLSVLELANTRIGQPSRITATARLGRGEVVDIERESELGGAIHSKGVLILTAFLAARFARNQPLSLAASLVFEQSYGMVEGDSASLAELIALLSAIAEWPVHQGWAVTGSVNQLGQVQPVGGINEKIEGFFDICRQRGLTGEQGVLIPVSNLQHLMLRSDVVEAVAGGKFRVYAVETVDQAISLVTNVPAGERDPATGEYPAGSFNGRVESRLRELTRVRQKLAATQFQEAQRTMGEATDN